jgi:hypothetical protein
MPQGAYGWVISSRVRAAVGLSGGSVNDADTWCTNVTGLQRFSLVDAWTDYCLSLGRYCAYM